MEDVAILPGAATIVPRTAVRVTRSAGDSLASLKKAPGCPVRPGSESAATISRCGVSDRALTPRRRATREQSSPTDSRISAPACLPVDAARGTARLGDCTPWERGFAEDECACRR